VQSASLSKGTGGQTEASLHERQNLEAKIQEEKSVKHEKYNGKLFF